MCFPSSDFSNWPIDLTTLSHFRLAVCSPLTPENVPHCIWGLGAMGLRLGVASAVGGMVQILVLATNISRAAELIQRYFPQYFKRI